MKVEHGVVVYRPEFSVRVEGVTDGAARLT